MKTPPQASRANPGRAGSARLMRPPHTAWLADRLSDRDWQIVEIVNRLRLVTGQQLERLSFQTLTGHAREVVRGRVLRRLVRWHVLAVSQRRIGGAARGSAGAAFALGRAGAHLYAARQMAQRSRQRVRHPGLPTERTVRHMLAVSEMYVSLVEQARLRGATVMSFTAEPACWWPSGLGGYVKPDAYTLVALGTVRDHWWVEVDLATESLPTLKRKLGVYVDFVHRGQLGPHGVVPRVLVSTVSVERRDALKSLAAHLPEPASQLFHVVTQSEAVGTMLACLQD